jgi:3-methyladenine DNA glycosylase Mpg
MPLDNMPRNAACFSFRQQTSQERQAMQVKKGDKVSYVSYGVMKSAIVESVSKDGKLVFIGKSRFLHVESIVSINDKPVNSDKE